MKNKTEITSPFMFGKTVIDNKFIDRTYEQEHLWLNLKSGINTVLISPRRIGKSSLVRQTFLNNKNTENIKW